MKKLLLSAALFLFPSVVNAQMSYKGVELNRTNNFGYSLYNGYFNGYGYAPGYSYYPNSQFFSRDTPGGRFWFHQGYAPLNYNRGYGNYYNYNFGYQNNYFYGRRW